MSKHEKLWGSVTILNEGHNYRVKEIVVLPGEDTSIESHDFRTEIIHIVGGHGEIAFKKEAHGELFVKHIRYGDQFTIPEFMVHNIRNTNGEDLILIQVEFGSWLSDEDVTHWVSNMSGMHRKS